jgi:hypothetical protein
MDPTRTRGAPHTLPRSRRPVVSLPFAFLIAAVLGISPVVGSTTPTVAPATPRGEPAIGSLQLGPVYEGMTGAVALGTPSGGFSSAPGMYPLHPGVPSVPTVSLKDLPADLGTPSGGFSSAPGMSPDTTVPPAETRQP